MRARAARPQNGQEDPRCKEARRLEVDATGAGGLGFRVKEKCRTEIPVP